MIKTLTQRKNQVEADTYAKIHQLLLDQVVHLLDSVKVKNGLSGFNKTDKKGNTVLSKALKHKMIELSRRMISSGSLDLTAKQTNTGLTPMHLIAHHIDDIATVQAIFSDVDMKQVVKVTDKYGNTPLHYAAIRRNLPMCQMLCEVSRLDVNT